MKAVRIFQALLSMCALTALACAGADDKPAADAAPTHTPEAMPKPEALQKPEAAPKSDTAPAFPERAIKLFNTHTRETVSLVFKRGDDFDAEALKKLDHVALDHRSGESHEMDARLFDQLFELAQACGVAPDFEIISGYRSPESNAKMAAREGSGVAKKSLHMQGRAIDVRLRKCATSKLRDLALEAKRGGVGYYQRSDFVHVDTGSFRTWTGK